MYGLPLISLGIGLVLGLSHALTPQSTTGDSLTASVHKESVLLYEPLVVKVTLHLEEPFRPDIEDPYEAARQLRRLHRRLVAEIHESGSEVYRIPLSSPTFIPTLEPARDFHGTVFGFLGRTDERGQTFIHFERPGSYLMVVRDLENLLKSDPVPLTISDPDKEDADAAVLFGSSFPEALMVIVEHKGNAETIARFERLAREFPDTPYGKYAIVSLALVHYKATFAEHNNKGGAQVWGPVAADLAKAAAAFDGWHPLRGQALFDLARAQALAGQLPDALRTTQTLCTEFPDGKLGQKARALLSGLNRKNIKPG